MRCSIKHFSGLKMAATGREQREISHRRDRCSVIIALGEGAWRKLRKYSPFQCNTRAISIHLCPRRSWNFYSFVAPHKVSL